MVSSLIGPMSLSQRPIVTFRLDLQQAGNLHRCTQKDGVKYLLPWVLWKLSALGQGVDQSRKAKHLIEISLEACRLKPGGLPFL
jgi:hypothetical protein